jgi:hypothetical protein
VRPLAPERYCRSHMVFSYYHRLDPRRQRLYKLSDAIQDLPLARPEALRGCVLALETSLASGERAAVARNAQALTDALCKELQVPSVRVEVLERRPAQAGSELYGLYEYSGLGRLSPGRRRIRVWMYTAKLGKVVAFRTFLRTLVHEICHHLDVTLLRFPESLHTEGFYARESWLVRRLLGEEDAAVPTSSARPSRPFARTRND